jgi:protein-L-isoaspartate O-methyltransferase
MLLASTNHVCQDVAVVPLLWVVPLALYLLSFIICFDHARWYVRPVWATAAVLTLLGAVLNDCLNDKLFHFGLLPQLAIYFSALFGACMVCHGELVRRKPDPRHLTEFYLLIAAGGALGGVMVAVVAPLLFSMYLEWQVGVAASAVLSFGMLTARGAHRRKWLVRDLCYGAFAFVAVVGFGYAVLWPYWLRQPSPQALIGSLDRARNFFGTVAVTQESLSDKPVDRYRVLVNGRIRHGCQFVDPSRRHEPTSYYGEPSGVGRAIRYLQKAGPIRIGAIGLGTGTLAAYARPGDTLVFYEINPEVVRMARQYFTYLGDCRGELQLVMGDARLSLASELGRQRFDLLVVDAFSGDAIPTHLLTREALDIYRRHLAPKGVVAFHVSNTYLRLAPIVRRLADDCGMLATRIDHDPTQTEEWKLLSGSTWVLLTRDGAFARAVPSDPPDWPDDGRNVPLWTDQYSNLFRILKSR